MAEQVAEKPRVDEKPRDQQRTLSRPRRRMGPVGWVILLTLLVAAGVGAARLWTYLQSYEETDDAQIDGDIYAVTSRVAGTITAVHVQDNQVVKAGQLLVELDPADYRVA